FGSCSAAEARRYLRTGGKGQRVLLTGKAVDRQGLALPEGVDPREAHRCVVVEAQRVAELTVRGSARDEDVVRERLRSARDVSRWGGVRNALGDRADGIAAR